MADAGTFPDKRSVWPVVLGWLMFWNWKVGPRKPKDPKTKAKPATWWSFWRWKFWSAKPLNLKRSPIPSLGNLMKVDPTSWDIMSRWANRLAFLAVCANLVLCAVYAFIVATQSELPITSGWSWTPSLLHYRWFVGAAMRYLVIAIFSLVAFVVAVVMQLATDFSIPFASGLAGEKYRVIPTVAFIVIFPIAFVTTVSMKVDVYTGWGRERIAEAAVTSTANTSDLAVLRKYPVAPPPVEASDGLIGAAQTEITRIDGEVKTKTALRDDEDKNHGGRGTKWHDLDNEVTKLSGQLSSKRADLASAQTARAQRIEYDTADKAVKASAKTVSVSERRLLYDTDLVVWLRSVGMALISPAFVLMSFMIRAAKAEAAKRREAAAKGVATKQENANTFEGEFQEGAPINAPKIDLTPELQSGPFDPADTKTQKDRPHPDKAGDDFGARNSGYDLGEMDGPAEPDLLNPQ